MCHLYHQLHTRYVKLHVGNMYKKRRKGSRNGWRGERGKVKGKIVLKYIMHMYELTKMNVNVMYYICVLLKQDIGKLVPILFLNINMI